MNDLKFTQEIKDKWLEALKSGKYIQGFGALVAKEDDKTYHCCLGVLGEIHSGLNNNINRVGVISPYTFLARNNVDYKFIYHTNDDCNYVVKVRSGEQERNYSNVIPIIEQLPVKS